MLKDNKKEDYYWEGIRWQNFEQLSLRICTANFFQPLKVGKPFFEKADAAYRADKEKAKILAEELRAVTDQHRKAQRSKREPKPIETREKALELLKNLQDMKLTMQKIMFRKICKNKLQGNRIAALKKSMGIKCSDIFFN